MLDFSSCSFYFMDETMSMHLSTSYLQMHNFACGQ